MNSELSLTRPYPFTRLRALLAGVEPGLPEISFGIGEPRHPAPQCVLDAYVKAMPLFGKYPAAKGTAELREAISAWILRRYGAKADPETQILPTNGSREALFSVIQTIVSRAPAGAEKPIVVIPNPFYQIYEGSAFLAGAEPLYVPLLPENHFKADYSSITPEQWKRVQALVVCSPNNPTGSVMSLDEWKEVFELSAKWNFAVISDECYSEIYLDESNPPLGALTAAAKLGNDSFRNIVICQSLSKRSNVPGLRSGFCAGDAEIMKAFLLFRTYHGSALPGATQAASAAAWADEEHVIENRSQYRKAFAVGQPAFSVLFDCPMPDASFYLWAKCPVEDDLAFARSLYEQIGIKVLPGSFLSREVDGRVPGRGYVRLALVETVEEILKGTGRLSKFDVSAIRPLDRTY